MSIEIRQKVLATVRVVLEGDDAPDLTPPVWVKGPRVTESITLTYAWDSPEERWVEYSARVIIRKLKKDGTPFALSTGWSAYRIDPGVQDLFDTHRPTTSFTWEIA